MIGTVRLHDHTAAAITTSGASGDLRDQLKGAFGCAKVGEVQRGIGVDHADQCDVGKIQTFGNHLGPQQDLALRRPEIAPEPAHDCPGRSSNRYPCAGRRRAGTELYFRLQFLRASATVANPVKPAFRTARGRGNHIFAVVAGGFVPGAMVGQRDVTVRDTSPHVRNPGTGC